MYIPLFNARLLIAIVIVPWKMLDMHIRNEACAPGTKVYKGFLHLRARFQDPDDSERRPIF